MYEKGGRGFGWDPLLPKPPYGPRRRRAKIFGAWILLAPKAPKQNFGCQQHWKGRRGGGEGGPGGGTPVYGGSNTSLGVGVGVGVGVECGVCGAWDAGSGTRDVHG